MAKRIKKKIKKNQTALVHTFAKRLKDLRRERGVSQVKLALEAGLHISFIGRLERAESSATLDTVETIATTLGVAPGDLLAESGDQTDALPALRSQVKENMDRALKNSDRAGLHALAVISAALAR